MDDKSKNATEIALGFLQSGINLPFLPSSSSQLFSFSQQPIEEINTEEFVNLIQVDPGLATKILQLANSAYFSNLQNIAGLHRAVIQIGLAETINSVVMLYLKKALPKFPTIEGGFSDKKYWNHSLACAIANKMLGHPQIGTSILPGELYIAGLLHGIGKLILAIHRPDDLLQCLQLSKEFKISLRDAQLDHLGTTDSYIACEILKAWQLPKNICMAVKYYQFPDEAEEVHREFAALTEFAYYLANTSSSGSMIDDYCFDISQTWIIRESASPLTEEKTRDEFIEKIYSEINNKLAAMNSLDGEDKQEEKEDEVIQEDKREEDDEEIQTAKQPSNKPKKKGIISWLRSLWD